MLLVSPGLLLLSHGSLSPGLFGGPSLALVSCCALLCREAGNWVLGEAANAKALWQPAWPVGGTARPVWWPPGARGRRGRPQARGMRLPGTDAHVSSSPSEASGSPSSRGARLQPSFLSSWCQLGAGERRGRGGGRAGLGPGRRRWRARETEAEKLATSVPTLLETSELRP